MSTPEFDPRAPASLQLADAEAALLTEWQYVITTELRKTLLRFAPRVVALLDEEGIGVLEAQAFIAARTLWAGLNVSTDVARLQQWRRLQAANAPGLTANTLAG